MIPVNFLTLFNSPEIGFVAPKLIIFWEFSLCWFFPLSGTERGTEVSGVVEVNLLMSFLIVVFFVVQGFRETVNFFSCSFFLGFVYNGWARFFLKIPPLWRRSLCETDWGIEQKGKKQSCCDQDVGSLWDACRFCAIQGFKWEETGQCRGKRILTVRYFLVDSVGFFLGLIASCLRNDGFRV